MTSPAPHQAASAVRDVIGPSARRVRAKNRRNAKALTVRVQHAGRSPKLRGSALDGRSRAGIAFKRYREEVNIHLGAGPGGRRLSVVEDELAEIAAELRTLRRLAWLAVCSRGAFREDGEPKPALARYQAVVTEQRAVLLALGVAPREAGAGDLAAEIARQRAAEEGAGRGSR